MPPDPILVRNTREWIARAMDDLQLTETDPGAKPAFVRDALFHCQQAVEKVLKAFLTWHDKPFHKTHDLRELADQSIEIDPLLADVLSRTERMSDYAWRFRYPGAPYEPAPGEAAEARKFASEVVDAILSRLPPKSGLE